MIQIFQPTILSTLRNEGALSKEYLTSQGLVDLKRLTMDKVGHVEVTVGEFCAVFKGDDYCPKMIGILKAEALELQRVAEKERKQLEELRRQREELEEVVAEIKQSTLRESTQDQERARALQAAETFISKVKARVAASSQQQPHQQRQASQEQDAELEGKTQGMTSELSFRAKGQDAQRATGASSASPRRPFPPSRGQSSTTLAIVKQGLLEKVTEYTRKATQQSREKDQGRHSLAGRSSAMSVEQGLQPLAGPTAWERSSTRPLEKAKPPAARTPRQPAATSKRLKQPSRTSVGRPVPRRSKETKGELHDEQKGEAKALEKEYMQALRGAHTCNLNEIRIDQNDSVRAFLLETLLVNIRKHYRAFREDMQNEQTILHGQNIDPSRKLGLVKQRQLYDAQLQKTYGSGRGYHIFREIMRRLVVIREERVKNEAA